jgi:hypothetical protein
MPQTPCSYSYFPPANIAAIHGSTTITKFTAKGGGGFIFIWNQLRPFLPIAGMKAGSVSGTFEYLTTAQNIAGMPSIITQWFQAVLNASVNYATDNLAAPDQIINGNDNYFAGYLAKRVAPDAFMLARYLYLANLIYNFWVNANPAWTTAQQETEINTFKVQLMNNLADPNLYLAPANYDFGLASAFSVALAAFKVATAALVAFESIEIYTP